MSDRKGTAQPLDEEQRMAVESSERALAVLAGPGSGKTRTLSYRAQYLLGSDARTKALMLTFTNKAAAEMKARALSVSTVASDRIWASTFHTFGLRVLRSHGALAGLAPDFEVLDDDEREELSREAAARAGVSDRYRRWSYLRLRRQEAREPEVIRFGLAYESAKREGAVVDFDDLIVHTADVFREHDQIAEAYATQFPHLLVDEFQDTNAAQFAVVQALGRHAQSVSVFADDDQAIYRFAGAEAENVRRFMTVLEAREYPLTVNYRCHRAIVECANRLIAADSQASGRQMRAYHEGGEVRSLVFSSQIEEASAIAGEIAALVIGGQFRAHEIAVLARSAFRARETISALAVHRVPVSNWLGPAHQPHEFRALRTCLSVVRGPLDARRIRRLCAFLRVPESDERDPVRILEQHSDNAAAVQLLTVRSLAWEGAPVSTIIQAARAAVAAVDSVLAAEMGAIVVTVREFERFDPEFALEHLMAELSLGGVGGAPTLGGGVKVATIHRTKGLQWAHVYVLGLEEGRLPDFHAATDEELREERRACFVAVCRAERRLTLTRTQYDRHHLQHPSRFLEQMALN